MNSLTCTRTLRNRASTSVSLQGWCHCGIANTRCFELFGSADADASFFSGRSQTPLLSLHARPCSPLWVPMSVTNTTCGIQCWDSSVMIMLAYYWRHIFGEVDMGRISLSCHFLDVLCDKAEVHCPNERTLHSAPLPLMTSLCRLSVVTLTTQTLLGTRVHDGTWTPYVLSLNGKDSMEDWQRYLSEKEESQLCQDATVP